MTEEWSEKVLFWKGNKPDAPTPRLKAHVSLCGALAYTSDLSVITRWHRASGHELLTHFQFKLGMTFHIDSLLGLCNYKFCSFTVKLSWSCFDWCLYRSHTYPATFIHLKTHILHYIFQTTNRWKFKLSGISGMYVRMIFVKFQRKILGISKVVNGFLEIQVFCI